MEDALGDRPSTSTGTLQAVLPERVRRRIFLIALERGFLDSALDRLVIDPFTRIAHRLTRFDQWLCAVEEPDIDGVQDE
jgi:hypothetical protein